jgi:hypothetical protein
MTVRGRLDRLRRAVGRLPSPGQLDTVVFEGAEPDPAVVAGLEERLAAAELTIIAHP